MAKSIAEKIAEKEAEIAALKVRATVKSHLDIMRYQIAQRRKFVGEAKRRGENTQKAQFQWEWEFFCEHEVWPNYITREKNPCMVKNGELVRYFHKYGLKKAVLVFGYMGRKRPRQNKINHAWVEVGKHIYDDSVDDPRKFSYFGVWEMSEKVQKYDKRGENQ